MARIVFPVYDWTGKIDSQPETEKRSGRLECGFKSRPLSCLPLLNAVRSLIERRTAEGETMNRSKLSQQQADDVEFEMRQLESNPRTTTLQMRLFMQSTMPCGHAVGNLLTCDRPPNGCVICGSEAAVDADITTMELCRFVLAIWDLYHDGRLKFEWRDADKHDDVIEWLNEAQRVAMIQYQRILIEPCAAP